MIQNNVSHSRLTKGAFFQLTILSQTSNKVKNMFEIVFDPQQDEERREKGADNLVVLSREKSGTEALFKEDVVPRIARQMKVEKNRKIRLSLIRQETLKRLSRMGSFQLQPLTLDSHVVTFQVHRRAV